MKARARLFGHPIHTMLIVFPLGLLATAVVFDLVRMFTGDPTFGVVAYWMIAAGLVGGLLAAPFGLLDWTGIPAGTRAKSVGLTHGVGNLVVVLLFAASWWLRRADPEAPASMALILSFAGGAIALFTAWLGGELVSRMGVGVDEGAHVDATGG